MTLKIDARAVNAELQAVSKAMSEVTRLMGPQTWQGGSAAAFTTDLQGYNRALNRLMLDVERTVARFNQVPLVLDPPDIPRVTPAAGKPGVASVSPSALERLETALTRAAGDLPHRGKMIRGHLALAHPDIPSTAPCDDAAAWCRTQAARMRTRIMYALAETEVGATPLIQGPVIQIPDLERFGEKEMTDLARLQARAWQKHTAHPGAATPALMAEIARTLRENSKNTAYLATFFSNVPAGSVGKLPYRLHQLHKTSGLTPEDKKTVGDMGTALAALSRRKETEGIAGKALGPAGADMPGQALLVRLGNGPWGAETLAALGQAALRWRQQHATYRMTWTEKGFQEPRWTDNDTRWAAAWGLTLADHRSVQQYDPALTILGEIASEKNQEAARLLALGRLPAALATTDPRNSKFLPAQVPPWLTRLPGQTYASALLAPDWPDGGKRAGSVIALAIRPSPGHESEAADIARQVVWAVSRWNGLARADVRKFLTGNDIIAAPDGIRNGGARFDLPEELQKALLSVATRYIGSFSASIGDEDPSTPLLDDDPVTEGKTFRLSGWTTQQFLSTFTANEESRRTLLLAAQSYERLLLAGAARGGVHQVPLVDAMSRVGHLEGNIIHGLKSGYIDQGKAENEALAAAQKEGEAARGLTESLFSSLPGAGLTGKFLPEIIVNDPEQLLSKAEKEKLGSIDENTQTVGYGWGTVVKTELAISLFHDGTDRNPKVNVDGTTYDISKFFQADGRLKKIDNVALEVLRRWGELQLSDGRTGENLIEQANSGFTNTGSPAVPRSDVDPPPTWTARG
ncbi:hypothetical protein [Actinomadura chokoriensis]|uniref:WXG100 family type VII secretion target n=1 Tax=Actinomadura chokoriensis TaxID=454156 RepID=A0ABV4R7J7_9ACTN